MLLTARSDRESAWFLLPPAALSALDNGLSLYSQSDAYWAGDYGSVSELSPSFAKYLAIHPIAFAAAGVLWIELRFLAIQAVIFDLFVQRVAVDA